MKNNYKIFLIVCLILVSLISAEEKLRNKFALGISVEETYIPTIRTKFKVYKLVSLELRISGYLESNQPYSNYNGVVIIGTREYFDITKIVSKTKNLFFYAGTEFDYVTVNQTMDSFGNGYVFGCFLGVEKYISIGTSLSFDFGPYYTYLKHKLLDVKEEGVDFIFNILINFYFF